MSATKGTEEMNEQGVTETKVDTVDYRKPAGEDKEPIKEDIHVVHLTRNDKNSGTGGGPLAGAAAKVGETVKSAKNAVFGTGKNKPPNE